MSRRKLVIAVDCDDVLVPGVETLLSTYNRRYNTAVRLENAYNPDSPEWGVSREKIFSRFRDIHLSDDFPHSDPLEETQEVVRRLSESCELHLVTAREPELERVTNSIISRFFPGCFASVEHTGGVTSKGVICQKIGANILIDDGLHNLIKARDSGLEWLVKFGNYPWQDENELVDFDNLISCDNWLEVETEIERIASS